MLSQVERWSARGWACVVLLSSVLAAQGRPIRPLSTPASQASAGAVLSPDGQWVAYGFAGTQVARFADGIVVRVLPAFGGVWAADSRAIYQLGRQGVVTAYPIPSGAPRVVGTVPGAYTLGFADAGRNELIGARATTAPNVVFALDLATGTVQDLFSEVRGLPSGMRGFRWDPTGDAMLYQLQTGRLDSQLVALPRATLVRQQFGSGSVGFRDIVGYAWADAGTTAVIHWLDYLNPGNELSLNRSASILVGRSWGLYPSTTVDRAWMALQWAPPGAPATWLGLMPPTGGGVVEVHPGQGFGFQGSSSAVSFDAGGRRFAFVARRDDGAGGVGPLEVFVGEVEREVRITPRPALGVNLSITLPLDASEMGWLVLGTDRALPGLAVPGLVGRLHLDPALLLPLAVGSGAPLTASLPIPVAAPLVGSLFFVQGVRLVPGGPGELTRVVSFHVP